MKRVKQVLALGCALLCGCKAVRVYPIAGPQGDPQAFFEPLIACATAERLVFRVEPDALHVQLRPGISAQFTPRRSGYTVVVTVDDGSGGGDREGHFAAAKHKSELLFACARGPEPSPPAETPPAE
jgi:hypothetical protein